MGPRSFERGNERAAREELWLGRLQWGRARSSAETFERQYSKWGLESQLQWGRARSSAETDQPGSLSDGWYRTSMGPRSFERGNTARYWVNLKTRYYFNGAALVRARNVLDARQVDVGGLTSMGPRSFERGNQRPDHVHHADERTSMGPRSFERGNVTREEKCSMRPG